MYASHLSVSRRSRVERDLGRGFALTERDRQVITEIYLQRALTRRHLVARGHFKSVSVANGRLRKLFDAGYIRRTFVPTGAFATEAVYLPGRESIPELVALLGADRAEVERVVNQDAPRFLEHSLAVADVRGALEKSQAAHGYASQWLSEPECRHEYQIETPVKTELHVLKPDGALLLTANESLQLYFVEVDRGHVSSPQFGRSCAGYRKYIERGMAFDVYGTHKVAILCVTTGGERRVANLATAAEQALLTVRFATFSEVMAEPFGRIWRCSGSPQTARNLFEVCP